VPDVVVLGGPNGAGKTTCANTVLPDHLRILQFVNADTIAAGLSGFAPETVAFQAGRVMLSRIEALSREGASFSFETTLASRTFAPLLRRLKGEGYTVTVVYVWLHSPDLAVRRVAERVKRGGHPVPAEDVHRRYSRGLANFWQLYRPIADLWLLCDNSDQKIARVARGAGEQHLEVFHQELYHEIEQRAGRG
jgi:predicted ABC-type ATPase